MNKVAIFIGSASDKPLILPCLKTLKNLGISFFIKISSAHRTPERTVKLIKEAEAEGVAVFICAAGMAAHLAGAVAAHTLRPVIAIPILGSAVGGIDALLSSVQMPTGFPVATVAINGAKNAALLAAQILALHDSNIYNELINFRKNMYESIVSESDKFEKEWDKLF